MLATVVALTLVTLLASTGAAGDRRSTPGVTSTSVTVGGLGYAGAYGDAAVGAQALFDVVNRAGGVHGRRIDFVGSTDDQGTPAVDAAAGRQLVSGRQVLAVVPTVTPYFSAAPILAQAQLPAFGWGLSTGFCDNWYTFAITGCLAPAGRASSAPRPGASSSPGSCVPTGSTGP